MSNPGNFLNRIGIARRKMWEARFIAVISIGIAIWGWYRVINKLSNNECMKYAETMCNN